LAEKIAIAKVRHPGERWSLAILVLFAVVALALLIVSVVGLIWLAVFLLLEMVAHQLAMAFFRANSILVSEEQYPAIYRMAKAYSTKLGLKKVPDVYVIQQTTLNAFAIRAARRHVVVLYSHTVETMVEKERTDALGMVIAHEIGHLAANHLRWAGIAAGIGIFLLPLYLYWSRCCEFTADRLAYLCLNDKGSALEGLLKLTVGKKLAPATNLEALARQHAALRKDPWAKIIEWWSTHPHLLNRIHKLQTFTDSQVASSQICKVGGGGL